jgi:hypothetical protein
MNLGMTLKKKNLNAIKTIKWLAINPRIKMICRGGSKQGRQHV